MDTKVHAYIFTEDDYKVGYEARFWNCGGKQIAIVAVVTKDIDWAAYIGADNSYTEDETLNYVARRGCKLTEKDARYFFPGIELPYRN